MRKLSIVNNVQGVPEELSFAVVETRNVAEPVVVARFRTEQDAKLFAGAERKIADLTRQLEADRQEHRSASYNSYRRGLLAGQEM